METAETIKQGVLDMQPRLTLKDGTVVALSDEVYELILGLVQAYQPTRETPASLDDLEVEFADLFNDDAPSTNDLLEEHRQELAREERKRQRLA